MARIIGLALLLLALVVSAAPAAEVYSQWVADTGAYRCGARGDAHWINYGPSIKLKQITLWMGMSAGGRSDYRAILYRLSDWQTLAHVGWDHYADPVAPNHAVTVDLGADWVTIVTGDGVWLYSDCTPGTPGISGHVAAFLRYVY